ncbi:MULTISPECIES: GxxExxY protein [Bacteroides]
MKQISILIKAVSEMDDDNKEQCINYMYAAKKLVGLLVNFRCSSIQKERFVNFDLLNKEI